MDVPLEIWRRVQQFIHKLLDIGLIDPGSTQPHLNFRGFQVFGLSGPESIHITLIHGVLRGGSFRFFQLLPHVAGQVFVRCDPSGVIFQCAPLGIVEDDTLQVGGQLVYGLPGQAGHIPQIHTGTFPNGDRQGVHSSIHRSHNLVGLNGTLGEHIRLALEVSIIIQNFQGTQEIVG